MKRGVIALEEGCKIKKKEMKNIKDYMRRNDIDFCGIVHYPQGFILCSPEIIIDMLKKAGMDYIFTLSTEFTIMDIASNGRLSALAKRKDITIIDGTFLEELDRVPSLLPDTILDEINDLIKMMNLPRSSEMEKSKSEKSTIVIMKDVDKFDLNDFMENIGREGYNSLNVIEVDELSEALQKMMMSLIGKNKVDHIYILDDYDSPKLDEFIDEIRNKNIEVTFMIEQTENRLMKMFMN